MHCMAKFPKFLSKIESWIIRFPDTDGKYFIDDVLDELRDFDKNVEHNPNQNEKNPKILIQCFTPINCCAIVQHDTHELKTGSSRTIGRGYDSARYLSKLK